MIDRNLPYRFLRGQPLKRQRCIHFTVKKNIVFLTTSSKGEGWKEIPIFVIVIQSFLMPLEVERSQPAKCNDVEKFLKLSLNPPRGEGGTPSFGLNGLCR